MGGGDSGAIKNPATCRQAAAAAERHSKDDHQMFESTSAGAAAGFEEDWVFIKIHSCSWSEEKLHNQ